MHYDEVKAPLEDLYSDVDRFESLPVEDENAKIPLDF